MKRCKKRKWESTWHGELTWEKSENQMSYQWKGFCIKTREMENLWKINTESLFHSHFTKNSYERKYQLHIHIWALLPNVIRLICTTPSGFTIRVFSGICCTHHWTQAYASIRSWRFHGIVWTSNFSRISTAIVQMYQYVICIWVVIFVVALRACYSYNLMVILVCVAAT